MLDKTQVKKGRARYSNVTCKKQLKTSKETFLVNNPDANQHQQSKYQNNNSLKSDSQLSGTSFRSSLDCIVYIPKAKSMYQQQHSEVRSSQNQYKHINPDIIEKRRKRPWTIKLASTIEYNVETDPLISIGIMNYE